MRGSCRRAVFTVAAAVSLVGGPDAAAQSGREDVLATASYGEAQVSLRRVPDDRTRRELVFARTATATPRVLDVRVPPRNERFASHFAENVALGLDGGGRLTVVLQSRGGLRWTHVTRPRLHRVPGTTRNDTFPSLFRGSIAYARVVGDLGSVVRVGALDSARSRAVWSNLRDEARTWVALETAIGRKGAVGIVTAREGAGNGAFRALLGSPGRKAKRLESLALGHTHEGGLSVETTTDGRRLIVSRTLDGATKRSRFALPSGRPL